LIAVERRRTINAVSGHQQSWDEALATEQTHQRELLATLRGELGSFARECADALTALDDFVGGGLGVRPRVAELRLEADTAAGRSDVRPLLGGRG